MQSIVLCLCFSLVGIKGATRENVIITGSTVGPDFYRPEGRAMARCPSSHPHVVGNGKQCCRFPVKVDDTSLAADCDGGVAHFWSSPQCCWEGDLVDCEDLDGGCNYGTWKDSCQPSSVSLVSYTPYWSNWDIYAAEHVLEYSECDDEGTYYVTMDYVENAFLIFDFGCTTLVTSVTMRNTRTDIYNKRGTENFTLELSDDQSEWTELTSGTLPNAKDVDRCSIPEQTFHVRGYGRYLRFTATSYYPAGAGLGYINFTFVEFRHP